MKSHGALVLLAGMLPRVDTGQAVGSNVHQRPLIPDPADDSGHLARFPAVNGAP